MKSKVLLIFAFALVALYVAYGIYWVVTSESEGDSPLLQQNTELRNALNTDVAVFTEACNLTLGGTARSQCIREVAVYKQCVEAATTPTDIQSCLRRFRQKSGLHQTSD